MPFIPTFILTSDDLTATPYQAASLKEACEHEPSGVYTVARTFQHDRVLMFDAHLDRLEQSAHFAGIPLNLVRARLRDTLRDLIHQADFANTKFRITVPAEHPDHIYLSLEELVPVPDSIMTQGARLKTVPATRENPVIKTTEWMVVRYPTYSQLPPNVYYEGLMITRDGTVLEGLSSNFYGILDGVLHTAPDDVLEGVTRRAVLEFAPAIVPVELNALHRDDLPHLSEAMISSSGRGIVPVTGIDDFLVGNGTVSHVVTALIERYQHWTATRAEPI